MNLPYVLWVLATAVFLLSAYSYIYAYRFVYLFHTLVRFSRPYCLSAFPRVPLLFAGISQNLLLVFLIVLQRSMSLSISLSYSYFSQANILTGVVNLSMQTIYASSVVAFAVLSVYLTTLSILACTLKWFDIRCRL